MRKERCHVNYFIFHFSWMGSMTVTRVRDKLKGNEKKQIEYLIPSHPTMSMSDSLAGVSASLPFRLVSRYFFIVEDLPGAPRFRRVPFITMLLPKTPEEWIANSPLRLQPCCLPVRKNCRPLPRRRFRG